MKINIYLGDSLKAMETMKDKQYGLALVDPPYGINGHKQRVFNDLKKWDKYPPKELYFNELKRITKNQIIWGANYFKSLWPCKGFIVWDKRQPFDLTFAMCEMAYTSFDIPAKMFFTKPAGIRGFYIVDSKRIHPTQKPIALYKWLLKNYGFNKDGSKRTIFDSHGGSRSIVIACIDMGFDIDCWEIDKDYHEASIKRIKNHLAQTDAFREPVEINYFDELI